MSEGKMGIESEEFRLLLLNYVGDTYKCKSYKDLKSYEELVAHINAKLLEAKREERERCAEVCDECDDVGDPVYMCSRLIRSLPEEE